MVFRWLFFTTVTPIELLMCALGKARTRLRFHPNAVVRFDTSVCTIASPIAWRVRDRSSRQAPKYEARSDSGRTESGGIPASHISGCGWHNSANGLSRALGYSADE